MNDHLLRQPYEFAELLFTRHGDPISGFFVTHTWQGLEHWPIQIHIETLRAIGYDDAPKLLNLPGVPFSLRIVERSMHAMHSFYTYARDDGDNIVSWLWYWLCGKCSYRYWWMKVRIIKTFMIWGVGYHEESCVPPMERLGKEAATMTICSRCHCAIKQLAGVWLT